MDSHVKSSRVRLRGHLKQEQETEMTEITQSSQPQRNSPNEIWVKKYRVALSDILGHTTEPSYDMSSKEKTFSLDTKTVESDQFN